MKNKFNIIYNRLVALKLDENILCAEFWKKIINLQVNFDEEACWKLTFDNIEWLINSGVLNTTEFKEWFDEKELSDHNIFISGQIQINDKVAIGMGNAKIVSTGHSKVILFDTAHCDAFDSSFVKGFHNSSFDVKECMGEAFNNCKCVAGYQSKVEAWDTVNVEAKDYSFVIRHDQATGLVSSRAHSVIQ